MCGRGEVAAGTGLKAVRVNLYESQLSEQLDALERLLNESRELERQLHECPEQARGRLDEWASLHSPLFQQGYEAALACLSGTSRLEEIAREKPAQVQAWSSAAVGGDTQFRVVRDHLHPIGPIAAEQLGARASILRVAWDRQMEGLLELARRLTAPAIPPGALEFQERCRQQLAELESERGGPDFDIRARLVLSDLKKELGKLGLSWELRRSLSEPLESFGQ